jgi:hypothetical protein
MFLVNPVTHQACATHDGTTEEAKSFDAAESYELHLIGTIGSMSTINSCSINTMNRFSHCLRSSWFPFQPDSRCIWNSRIFASEKLTSPAPR